MHISHVGHSILCTPHDSFQLKSILHVPNASKKSALCSSVYS
jgi:hypothetical protein